MVQERVIYLMVCIVHITCNTLILIIIIIAICFVLGISQNKIRANSTQDLIFKRGQAGVTRASVTITFDNRDKKKSPQGFQAFDEIMVARIVHLSKPAKYMLNGKTVTAQTLHKLFSSIQLNVTDDNPNFLILQGNITRVINMKPEGILKMIAETAGTNNFDMQKREAEKMFARKDKKLEEIDRVLNQDIIPTMTKLRKEQQRYVEWSNEKSKIEHLERFTVALHYSTKKDHLVQIRKDLERVEKEIEEIQAEVNKYKQEQSALDKKLENKKSDKQTNGLESKRSVLEKKVAELSKELVKKNTEYEHKKENYNSEKKRVQGIMEQIESDQLELENTRIKSNSSTEILQTYRESVESCQQKLDNLKKQRSDVEAGLAVSSESDGQTLTEQLRTLKDKANTLETESKQAQLRIQHLSKSIRDNEGKLQKMAEQGGELQARLQVEEQNLTALKKSAASESQAINSYQTLRSEIKKKQSDLKGLSEEVNNMGHEVAQFYFSYDKKLFANGAVKGTVAELLKIREPEKTSVALEVTAGPKLYQIVVDNEETAKKVISTARGRVTVIPLNKVRPVVISDEILQRAKNMKAESALVMIEYDREVDPAMKHTFANTLICKDFEDARRVAYHETIRRRTVTYDGDSFDPAGTLTGGSRPRGKDSPLLKLALLQEKKQQRDRLDQEIHRLNVQLEQMKALYDKAKEIQDKVILKEHELGLLRTRVSSSRHSQQKRQLEEDKQEVETLKGKVSVLEEQKELSHKQTETVEQQLEEFSSTTHSKSEQIKRIDKNIDQTKKDLSSAKQKFQSKEQECQRLQAQIQEQESDLSDLAKQLQELESQLNNKLKKEIEQLEKDVVTRKEEYDSNNNELQQINGEISQRDKELSRLNKKKEEIEQTVSSVMAQLRNAQTRKNKFEGSEKETMGVIDTLLGHNSWIKSEENLFGKQNSEYNFSNTKPLSELQSELAQLRAEHQKTSQTINKKVMSLIESSEKQYNQLMDKRKIIDQNRQKIQQTMDDLDQKKRVQLIQTWKKVNEDIGSIFSTLLPGAMCKLDPEYESDGQTLHGLEFRVKFGEVWKESLSELSGGQRSLLALSLILSLLRYKPAPMYILDEIDSALDLSHTQNIGRMLRTHFADSQFLIISLKEELFQNANVLFRTEFVEGSSTVKRITNHRSVISDEEVAAIHKKSNDTTHASSSSNSNSSNTNSNTRKRSVTFLDDDGDDESLQPTKRQRRSR
jgi:structural maintenance of chromosome 2